MRTLITHDKEFSDRRRKAVIGQHIWLDCRKWDAAQVIADHLDEIAPVLSDTAICGSRSHRLPR